MHRLYTALFVVTVVAGLPGGADAQLAELEAAFATLDKKLPTEVWDGKTMNIRDYDQLLEVGAFLIEYKRVLAVARKAYDGLSGDEQTEERRERLNGYADWKTHAIDAANEKAKEIKPPTYFPFTGPDVGKGKPFVIDTVGHQWTRLRVRTAPGPSKGNKRQPSRYSIYAEFAVYYEDMASEDVVLIQPTKGGKKLGPPKLCKTNVFTDIPVAVVNCDTHPGSPDYRDLYSASGDVQVQLIYRKVIEGKEFKNFETLLLRLNQLPQAGTYPPSWGADYDMELGPSIIQQYSGNFVLGDWADSVHDAWNHSVSHLPASQLLMRTMFKSNGSSEPRRVACLHEGKRVFESKVQDRWNASEQAFRGGDWQVTHWQQGVIFFYGVRSRPVSGLGGAMYFLSEHPGEYKCVITGGGKVLKELYFTIDAKGNIAKPACQAKSMNSPRSITLLTTKLKTPYNAKWDKKLAAKRAYGGGATWAKGCPPTK